MVLVEGQNSHKCIQPENGRTDNGVLLQQWTCTAGAANQEFYLPNG